MNATTRTRYWTRYVGHDGAWRRDPRSGLTLQPPGEDLAALRAGLGRPAGTVPALWPFYTCEIDERRARRDEVSDEQEAEHAALALFGLHQQGQKGPMHHPGTTLGKALRALRRSEKFSEQAVDSRVGAAVAATSVPILLHRLRGLVTQLRTVHQPVDYDRLLLDIERWSRIESRQGVRRRWGLDYHVWGAPSGDQPADGRDPSSPARAVPST